MKIAILTTPTPHHAYFVRDLAQRYPSAHVFCEDRSARAPFATAHPFEAERDAFETGLWFDGHLPPLSAFAPVQNFESMNSAEAVRALSEFRADFAIVFGTGRLDPAVIEAGPQCFVNLHGGDPEEYRGLDTHLWAIYHNDFGGLVTTLHTLAASLDAGDICLQDAVRIKPMMPLHQLRAANTDACVRLARAAVGSFADLGSIPSRKQARRGRYYSFMPSPLKEICLTKFQKHTARLAGGSEH